MSNAKHTPGPWAIIPKGKPFAGDIADNTGAVVAQAYLNEHQANAKLISAAPDMLEALEGLLKATRKAHEIASASNDDYADDEAHFVGEWMDEARAVIAKATE